MRTIILMVVLAVWGAHAEAHTIDLDIVAYIESSGNPKAFNRSSQARGLYQITPIVLKQYNAVKHTYHKPDDLFDPALNKIVAEYYLAWLDKLCDSDEEILIAYNWGIGRLRDWQDKGARFDKLPRETRDYVLAYRKLKGNR